jgi:hypothetical protein
LGDSFSPQLADELDERRPVTLFPFSRSTPTRQKIVGAASCVARRNLESVSDRVRPVDAARHATLFIVVMVVSVRIGRIAFPDAGLAPRLLALLPVLEEKVANHPSLNRVHDRTRCRAGPASLR